MMDCHYCRGVDSVDEQTALLSACESPNPFMVENVPTLVCELCGDKSYSSETLSSLEKIRKGEAQVSSIRAIRVFDFKNLEGHGNQAFHYGDYTETAWATTKVGITDLKRAAVSSDEYFLTVPLGGMGMGTFKMWAGLIPASPKILSFPFEPMFNIGPNSFLRDEMRGSSPRSPAAPQETI